MLNSDQFSRIELEQSLKDCNIIKSNGELNPTYRKLLVKYNLEECLRNCTSFLNPEASLRERIYAVKNELSECPICAHPRCFNPVNFINDGKKRNTYHKYCSLKCSNSDLQVKRKKEKTLLKNYDVTNPSHSFDVNQKKVNTCLKNHGVEFPQSSKEIHKKSKKTMLERYGTDNNFKRDEVRLKGTNVKIDQMWKSKTHQQLYSPGWLQSENQTKTLTQIASELNTSLTKVCRAVKDLGIDTVHHATSHQEQEVVTYIKSITNHELITNSRKLIPPYEVDIIIPDLKLAIEYDGVYWHSEDGSPNSKITKNYHLDKTRLCEQEGYRLIHIFENEWLNKTNIVKSRLASILNKSEKLGARKTTMVEVTNKQANLFLNENHIQGSCSSSKRYGLEYNGELVSLMTFGKARYNNDCDWELLRFCNKTGITVQGAASKLFSQFVKEHRPVSVVSYADKRWSQGNLYKQLQFKFHHDSAPNYFYVEYGSDTVDLHSRIQFQKHKLKDRLSCFDPTKSESENMFMNGYRRIWDCGNSVWIWKKDTPHK